MGGANEEVTDLQKQAVLKYLDDQLRVLWGGLAQNWAQGFPMDISVEEEKLQNGKVVNVLGTVHEEDPTKMRRFIEEVIDTVIAEMGWR